MFVRHDFILIMITITSFLDFECIYYKSFIINIDVYFLYLNLNITFKLNFIFVSVMYVIILHSEYYCLMFLCKLL